jgi:hypothetical protein
MRTGWRRWSTWLIVGVALLVPLPAWADVGIPVGAVFWPVTWLLFLPVVLVEAGVARRVLGLRFSESVKLSLKANAWSTLAGVPLACLMMFVLGLFLGSGANRGRWSTWLADVFLGSAVWMEGLPDWVLFAGPALICVPCYFLSVRIEAWSAANTVPRADAARWARTGNRITYGVLVGILLTSIAVTRMR